VKKLIKRKKSKTVTYFVDIYTGCHAESAVE